MKWLDKTPMIFFLLPALFLTFAPFVPEPHLVEKLRMLSEGNLTKGIDIFDLFWHGIFPTLVFIKVIRGVLIDDLSDNDPSD